MTRKKLSLVALLALLVGIGAFMSAASTPAYAFFNCKIVQCAAPDCEDNQHLQVPPGQCCPICVNN